jgi:hypothetical protein
MKKKGLDREGGREEWEKDAGRWRDVLQIEGYLTMKGEEIKHRKWSSRFRFDAILLKTLMRVKEIRLRATSQANLQGGEEKEMFCRSRHLSMRWGISKSRTDDRDRRFADLPICRFAFNVLRLHSNQKVSTGGVLGFGISDSTWSVSRSGGRQTLNITRTINGGLWGDCELPFGPRMMNLEPPCFSKLWETILDSMMTGSMYFPFKGTWLKLR